MDSGKIICGGGPSDALVCVRDVSGVTPAEEVPCRIPPQGGPTDGGNGPQTPI